MLFLRRTFPLILAFISGVIGILVFYVPHSTAQVLERDLAKWFMIISAFAYILGLYSLKNLHWDRVRAVTSVRESQHWQRRLPAPPFSSNTCQCAFEHPLCRFFQSYYWLPAQPGSTFVRLMGRPSHQHETDEVEHNILDNQRSQLSTTVQTNP